MTTISERIKNYKRGLKIRSMRNKAHKLERRNKQNNTFSPRDTIIISGQPRGGTTWLAETMTTHATTGIIWEPLHPKLMAKFDRTRELGIELGNFPFTPEAAQNEGLKNGCPMCFPQNFFLTNISLGLLRPTTIC